MQDIKEERFQQFGRVAPAVEVEGLKAAESEGVLYVVEKESVLAGAGPAMQTILQLSDDLREVR